MNEKTALRSFYPPWKFRPCKMGNGGVLQIHVTRACTQACRNCTQGSNLGGKTYFMTPDQFAEALLSLKGYRYLVAIFGGQPTLSPYFGEYCAIMRRLLSPEQRGLWTNALNGWGEECRKTFLPERCNLNVHMSQKDIDEFKRDWPEAELVGVDSDSRHAPVFGSMRELKEMQLECPDCQGIGSWDLTNTASGEVEQRQQCETCEGTGRIYNESKAWELISRCDIARNWSSLIGLFRGQLRAWICEIMGSQSILKQDDPEYPDTGLDPTIDYQDPRTGKMVKWWQLPVECFAHQVRFHCHNCLVPMRGYGALALDCDGQDQITEIYSDIYKPKRKGHQVQIVTTSEQLGDQLASFTDYINNAKE